MCDGNPTIRLIVGKQKNNKRKDKLIMNEKLYYTAAEVAEMIGVGRTTGYAFVKKMNKELQEAGYLVVDGKVPKDYFDEKYFGGSHRKAVGV